MATEKVTHLTTAKSPLAGKARKIRYLSASHLFKVPSAAECTSKFSEETLDNRESQAALAKSQGAAEARGSVGAGPSRSPRPGPAGSVPGAGRQRG